jgi:hypothetical protein
MSQDTTDTRLTIVERDLAAVKTDIGDFRRDVKASNVEILAAIAAMRDAGSVGSRVKGAAGYAFALVTLAGCVWFIISVSPAVTDLDKRLGKIEPIVKRNDDAMEWRPTAWTAEVRRSP